MTAKRKSAGYAAAILVIFGIFLVAGTVFAQESGAKDKTGPVSPEDRVAKRYEAGTPPVDHTAGAAKKADERIQKIPLPDFVTSKDNGDKAVGHGAPPLTPGNEPGEFDMQKSVERGLLANPQMQSARASILGSEEGRRQAVANFGPVASVSYGYQRSDAQVFAPTTSTDSGAQTTNSATGASLPTTHYSTPLVGTWQNLYQLQLAITQPLFTGFKLLNTYQKAELTRDQAKANLTYTELTLIKGVQKAFLTLLQARANVQSNKDSVARLESQFKVTQAYYDVGLKPRLDVLQAESDLATAEQNLLSAQNSVLVQTAQLNSLLNLPLKDDTKYVGELAYLPFSLSIEDCLDAAYKNRPDLYMAVKTVQIAERDARIAASPFYPQVQAQATWTKSGDAPGLGLRDHAGDITPDSRTIGVTASLRAWDWGSTYFGYRQARENVKKLQADLANMRLNVGYEVKTDFLNIQDAAKRISVARTGVEAAREGFRMAVARYQAQVGTNTDVLTSQAQVSQAEFNLTQALTDYQSALADLYVAMGQKNSTLRAEK